MLEAGSVRVKNTRNILLKNLLDACAARHRPEQEEMDTSVTKAGKSYKVAPHPDDATKATSTSDYVRSISTRNPNASIN